MSYGVDSFESESDLPLASKFGKGVAQAGSSLYVSDGANWTAAQNRTEVLKFATFGDSTANSSTISTASETDADQEYLTAPFPGSGATTLGLHLYKANLSSFYSLAEYVGNGGKSGETTANMIARDGLGATATRKATADIIALKPDVVLLRAGSINDIYPNKTQSAVLAAIPTTVANHAEIVARFTTAGIKVIDSGILGFGSLADTGFVFTIAGLLEINRQLGSLAAQSNGMWTFINPLNLLHDSTGTYLPNVSNDGVHLNSYGGDLLAKAEAKAIIGIFGKPAKRKFTGTNLMDQNFLTVTTDAKGTYPTGQVFGLTAATITDAKIEIIKGKKWATCIATPSGAATVTISLPFNPTTMGIVANDNFLWELDIFVEAVDGSEFTLTTLRARLDLYKTAAGRLIVEPTYNSVMGATNRYDVKVSKKIKIPEASASLTISSVFQFTITTSELKPLKIGYASPVFGKVT